MVAMQDSGVNEIVSSPQAYEAYLEIQANNPVYRLLPTCKIPT